MSTTKPGCSAGSVKDVLKAGYKLLCPPGNIPRDVEGLKGRVGDSWRALPVRWDEGLAGVAGRLMDQRTVGDEGEGGEAGVDGLSGEMAGLSAEEDDKDEALAKIRQLVGLRALDILVGLQSVLVREFWPAEVRGGDAKDFILGTGDLRLIRLLLAQSIALLSSLSVAYLHLLQISTTTLPSNPPLKPVLLALLSLLRPTPPPPSPSSSSSTTRPLPPTTVTQLLSTSHLPPILLSSILLGYTPSLPPSVHADIRQSFLSTLSSLPPSQAMLALSGILTLTRHTAPTPTPTPGPASISTISSLPSPPPFYPAYIPHITHRQLSAQLLRPTGVRALLLNIFGERALSDAEAVDEARVGHAIEVLRRVPSGVDEAVYTRHVVGECMELLGPARVGKGAPRGFKGVAGGVVGRWVEKGVVGEVLGEMFGVLGGERAGERAGEDGKGLEGGEGEERLRVMSTLDELIGYTDPAHLPALLNIIIPPILPALQQLAGPAESPSTGQTGSGASDQEERIAELAREVLDTWERVTTPLKP